jgi:hypothetical protein
VDNQFFDGQLSTISDNEEEMLGNHGQSKPTMNNAMNSSNGFENTIFDMMLNNRIRESASMPQR